MSCKAINLGQGATAILCSREPRARCHTTGCRGESVALCDYPIKRKNGAPGTCDRRMCVSCRRRQGEGVDYCPVHDRLAKVAAP
jgi:hypothetical protein